MTSLASMTLTAWALVLIAGLAAGLCIWAFVDDREAVNGPPRVPQHGRWVGEGATRRLPRVDAPTEIIPGQVARGRCHCLHLAHIGRCRAAECGCVSPEGYTDPGTR